MISLLWSGIPRLREVLDIRIKDVDLARAKSKIFVGSGGLRRPVEFGEHETKYVRTLLSMDGAWKLKNNAPLLSTVYGRGGISGDYVRGMLRRLASKAKIDKNVSARSIRASSILQMEHRYSSQEALMRRLGYNDVASLNKFIRRISSEFKTVPAFLPIYKNLNVDADFDNRKDLV